MIRLIKFQVCSQLPRSLERPDVTGFEAGRARGEDYNDLVSESRVHLQSFAL